MNRTIIISGCVCLFILLLSQGGARYFGDTNRQFDDTICDLIPNNISGWSYEDIPLAETEEMRKHVDGILQYDSVINRRYTNGLGEVDVYVAYWKPGKMPYNFVGIHTPDVCWVEAGWNRLEKKVVNLELGTGRKLKPMEYGVYEKEGYKRAALFAHYVGGEVNSYDQYGYKKGIWDKVGRFFHRVKDTLRFGVSGAKEQILVRISAEDNFDSMLKDKRFDDLLVALEAFPIFEE